MRRWNTTAAVVCLLMGASVAARASSPPESEVRAGVAAVVHGRGVLAMSGPLLPVGTKLSLVTVDLPQELRSARVVRVVSDDKDMHDRIPGPYYEIASTDEGRELSQLAVAVLGAPTASTNGAALSLRVSATLPDIRVRSCASHEGL